MDVDKIGRDISRVRICVTGAEHGRQKRDASPTQLSFGLLDMGVLSGCHC
jgi:hypothetical protein